MSGNGKMRMRKRRFKVLDASDGSPGRMWIDDDDFHWDALMRVSGDFESDAEKERYMKAIAKVLSDNEDKIPYRPKKSRSGTGES